MLSNALRQICFLTVLVAASSVFLAADVLPTIAPNDNRAFAGALRDGVLTIRLELGEGQWRPESDDGEVFTVYAFGEAGKALQNPGPLIRVPEGTEIRAIVHNALPVAATVHGLHARPGDEKDALGLPPDATQEVRFKTGTPGTYYYWATTTGRSILQRMPVETQLAGALIVDPPGAVAADRVFVIGVYYQDPPIRAGIPQEGTINGKAWPYAERPTYKVGEAVHWRWLNISTSEHAMHLHGFYYHLDAIGDGEHSQAYKEAERPLIVTRLVYGGETFDMTWVPERPGRWLFHCHMLIHMSPTDWKAARVGPQQGHGIPRFLPPASIGGGATSATAYTHQHGEGMEPGGMGGIVVGITVVDEKEKTRPASWHAERKLQLAIDERKDGGRPHYALAVRDLAQPPAPPPTSPPLVGPPIVLTSGQPVEIEVVNRTSHPTAIHWHGIELESYYDGVAGWTGTSQQTTPAIQPGESFVARMAPPRAGTFIYHTHWHDPEQLDNSIYGPLIVLPPGKQFDPATDKILLFSEGVFDPFGAMVLINGGPQPAPLRLATGTKYRFRMINISANFGRMRASLRQDGVPVQWRIIAKDGADLLAAKAIPQTAETSITVGETYDFEYEASAPQDLALEVLLPGLKLRAAQGLVFAENPAGK
ncbi:MAG: multicopper oxidase domain-containing protein [Terriglobales bacterium]